MSELKGNPAGKDDFYPSRQYTVDEILEEARLLRQKKTGGAASAAAPAPKSSVGEEKLRRSADELFEQAMRDARKKPEPAASGIKKQMVTEPAESMKGTAAHASQPVPQKRDSQAPRAQKVASPPSAPVAKGTSGRSNGDTGEENPFAGITPWHKRTVKHTPSHLLTPQEILQGGGASEQAGLPRKKAVTVFDEVRKSQEQPKKQQTDVIYKKSDAVAKPVKSHAFRDSAARYLIGQADEEEEAVKTITPGRHAARVPAPKEELPSDREPTRIIRGLKEQRVVVQTPDDLTGQVVLPGFERPQEDDGQWERSLEESRQKKVKNFVIHGSEEEVPAKEVPVMEEPDELEDDEGVIDDYETVADASFVRLDLIARRRSVGWRMMATAVLFLMLLGLSLMSSLHVGPLGQPEGARVLLGATAGLSLVAMLVNASAVFGGFASLFRLQVDLDTAVAIGMLVTFLHACIMFFFPEAFAASGSVLFNAAAVSALLFNGLGKLQMITRISDNFALVGNEDPKYALAYVEEEQDAQELGRGLTVGVPEVCYQKEIVNLKGYLNHSFAQDPADESAQKWAPFLFLAGVLGVLAAVFLAKGGGTVVSAVTAFSGAVCACLPVASLLAGNYPLKTACERLRESGVILTGYDAVYDFSDVNVVALDAQDLFPGESVQLYSIKTFGSQSIDKALLDAAGVAIMTGGPLAAIFQRVIEGHTSILPEVDTLVYEEGMGVSGWVSGHRVLIGNRQLMENHGISMPDADFEKKYTRDGKHAVFLSTMGILSAMFLISYQASDSMKEAVQNAVDSGLSLVVYSCDPNINEQMLSEAFEIPKNAVRVMNAASRHIYNQHTLKADGADASLAHLGSAQGYLEAVTATIHLRTRVQRAKILQAVLIVLCFVLAMMVMVLGGVSKLNVFYLLGSQLLTLVLVLVVPAVGSLY